MNTKFCGKCGASNQTQMKFCSQCGSSFENFQPVNNYTQPSPPAFSPTPNYAQQTPFQPPRPGNFPDNQNNFQPPNFNEANNYNASNQAFQPPQFHSESQSPAHYKSDPKPGFGSKIWSALGALVVGIFLFLKFGFVLLRAGRLGGIGLVAAIFLIVVGIGVYSLIKKA